MNIFEKKISKKFNFWEDSRYASTVASQQFYSLPNDFGKMKTFTVTVGTTKYFPEEITSREQWDKLNSTTSVTSDIPECYFIFNGQVGLYPTPASSISDAIYLQYHVRYKDLSVADYTTGSINSVANGATTVTGNGTSWTSKMAGMWIQITDSSTANTGDGYWYEIDSVEDATSLTLKKPYEGPSISSGTASYTIGQISKIPEDFQILPVFEALEIFFASIKSDTAKLAIYKAKVKEMKEDLMVGHGSSSLSPVLSQGKDQSIQNPNNFILAS